MNAKDVGAFISNLRKRKNLTQKALAEELNVSDKAVSKWETGKCYPDIETIERLSGFFGVSINEILCGRIVEKEDIVKGIVSFAGVGRRFEYKGSFCGADVYDDYAHHPDEIKVTLSAAKGISRGKVIAVFQPHNYSRLRDLFEEFITAFDDADQLILCPLYAAREACGEEVSSKMLADDIKGAIYFETFEEIKTALTGILEDGDLLIIMGAGDITALANSI